MIQGGEEWIKARLGKATASRASDVIAKTKTGWAASRANYMAELLLERLTGFPAERFTNSAMEWGTAQEPEARIAYEFYSGNTVSTCGFLDHPTIAMSGASPDGLIKDDGLVEIKAPNSATHLETLLGAKTPEKYVCQMQFQMAVTGRAWCDWVSFDPRMPEHLRLVIRRVERHEATITDLETAISNFLTELDEKVERLRHADAATFLRMQLTKSNILMAG